MKDYIDAQASRFRIFPPLLASRDRKCYQGERYVLAGVPTLADDCPAAAKLLARRILGEEASFELRNKLFLRGVVHSSPKVVMLQRTGKISPLQGPNPLIMFQYHGLMQSEKK